MTTAFLLAAGLAMGARPAPLSMAALAAYFPVPAVGVVLLLLWLFRQRPSARATAFCEAVSSELGAGDSLRNAVSHAALQVQSSRVRDLCQAGAPMEAIAGAVAEEFEDVGPELQALLVRSVELGTPPAELFGEVGDIALAQTTVAQEAAAATAPVRATAVVMLGALVLGLARFVVGEGVDRFLGSPAQLAAAGFGLLLVVAGTGLALAILTRDL